MDPRALVQPLEAGWQDVLDAVLRGMTRGAVSTREIGRLAPKLVELSRAYNAAAAEGRRTRLPLEARVAFSFPRDVPKGAGAIRELVASGVLALPEDRPLRVLDLGAGLGAMTWGLARALAASGARGRIEALLVDEDEEALRQAEAIARAARVTFGEEPIALSVRTEVASLATGPAHADRPAALARRRTLDRSGMLDRSGTLDRSGVLGGPHHVVLLGQVLSELDPRALPEERLEGQVALIAHLLESAVAEGGALVIVEPALRERARHLHALRARVLEQVPGVTVFAPCLHAAPCPALAVDGEWCHEDLRVDLPPWVAPLARAAGLRWQGLTFSYLVLTKDGRALVPRAEPEDRGRVRFRVVSDLFRSKGKVEMFVCTEAGQRSKIRRLDRDAVVDGVPFDALGRGDVVTLTVPRSVAPGQKEPDGAPIDDRGRVRADANAVIDVGAARK